MLHMYVLSGFSVISQFISVQVLCTILIILQPYLIFLFLFAVKPYTAFLWACSRSQTKYLCNLQWRFFWLVRICYIIHNFMKICIIEGELIYSNLPHKVKSYYKAKTFFMVDWVTVITKFWRMRLYCWSTL